MMTTRVLPYLVLLATSTAYAEAQPDEHPRCAPSCYHTEKPAKGAGTSLKTCGYFTKGMNQLDLGNGQWGDVAVNEGATEGQLIPSCKFPKPGKKWAALSKIARASVNSKSGDVVFVPDSESWVECTIGDDPARCIDIYWYGKQMDFDINACGTNMFTTCEADGSPAARAANVVQFRVEEASKLSAAGKKADCKKAALEAVAVSRGLAKKEIGFSDHDEVKYQTLALGTFNRKDLLKKVAELGKQAVTLYKGCGGGEPKTTEDDEQSYHARW